MPRNPKLLLPSAWALLVVDMQNDFLDAGGYYARRAKLERRADWTGLSAEAQGRLLDESAPTHGLGARSAAVEQAVAAVCRAIAAARAAGRPIAFVRAHYGRQFGVLAPFLLNDPERRHFPCNPGTWGVGFFSPIAEAIGHGARPTERVIDKHSYDAFTSPALPNFLEEMGVGAVIVCGTMTQVCVMATAQHAALLGFRSFILEDAVWSPNSAAAEAALSIFRDAYGATLTVGDLDALPAAPSHA